MTDQQDSEPPTIAALATAWGPRFGGINAFNTELLKSLGIQPDKRYRVACVVPQATQFEIDDAGRHGVEIVDLRKASQELGNDDAPEILRVLARTPTSPCWIWLGHDDKTGQLALALRAQSVGHAVVVHHMAHRAYQSFKKDSSAQAQSRAEAQRHIFLNADLCLAVGPMLTSHLQDLLQSYPNPPPVVMLVPGLADPEEFDVRLLDAAPRNFVAFVAGRLDLEDDRIKQGRLAVRAFGQAVRQATSHAGHAIARSPTLRMRGVSSSEQPAIKQLLGDAFGGALNMDLGEFTDDRQKYFHDLASSSVAMMPSWHEGFGLTAWEAIACAVPVVIGQQSGVYRLLFENCLGQGLGRNVRVVPVDGQFGLAEEEAHHTDEDADRVAQELMSLGAQLPQAKTDALRLRTALLQQGYDWRGCARSLIVAIEKELHCPLLRKSYRAPHPRDPVLLVAERVSPSISSAPNFLSAPAPRARRSDAECSPSALLIARDQLVGFDDARTEELSALLRWASGASRGAAHLLTGPAGIGKTRLAIELGVRLCADGWSALWLDTSHPSRWQDTWVAWLQQASVKRVMLVIDYAESRQADVLAALAGALAALRLEERLTLRVLLLARQSHWLAALESEGWSSVSTWSSGPPDITTSEVPPWPNTLEVRERSYINALTSYARVTGRYLPEQPFIPNLVDGIFDRPVYIHMAALATLSGERPRSIAGLVEAQLIREWRHWDRTHGKIGCAYDDWADALAWIALRQGVDAAAAMDALPRLLGPSTSLQLDVFVEALRSSYSTPAGGIEAIQPDILVDSLLCERLVQRRGREMLSLVLQSADTTARRGALAVIGRLVANLRDEKRPECWVILSRALADCWPAMPQEVVSAAQAAEAGLGIMLNEVWQELPESTRVGIAGQVRLPSHGWTIAELSMSIELTRLEVARSPSALAAALGNLSVRLQATGNLNARPAALAMARNAVALYRGFASAAPEYLDELASSLSNLAGVLADQSSEEARGDAIVYSAEATHIFELLAAEAPDLRVKLARALMNHASHLARDAGRSRTAAMDHGLRGLAILRELVEEDPAYLPELARSLERASHLAAKTGDYSAAFNYALESVQFYRKLNAERSLFLDMATALCTLAERYLEREDSSSYQQGMDCFGEAVECYDGILASRSPAYWPRIAVTMNQIAYHAARADSAAQLDWGVHSGRTAVAIYRHLVREGERSALPMLSKALTNLANLQGRGNEDSRVEAIAAAREALELNRIARTENLVPDIELAGAVHNLSGHLAANGDLRAALPYAREAVTAYEGLQTLGTAQVAEELALALNNLSHVLSLLPDAGMRQESFERAQQSLTLLVGSRERIPKDRYDRYYRVVSANLVAAAVALGRDAAAEVDAILRQEKG